MKKLVLVCLSLIALVPALAQDSMEKVMEQRAREMYRVISLNSPEEWKKFIKDNYSKALIDKPMRAQVDNANSGATASSSATQEGNIEGKAKMYQMLHDDFAGGKITSLKTTGDAVTMIVASGDMAGTFTLKFSREKPYLIDGLGIQVGN